ncbi:MAG: hypothetical protein SGI92_10975 [Bryobacteraceae bacterium]|nr:hypothetical protein [Bryobacteraceae bacterium]
MTKRIVLTGGLAATLLLTGCYNTPETSLRKPGEGPTNHTAGPAVGPGSTAGGSTAGPQPKPVAHKPESGEMHAAKPGPQDEHGAKASEVPAQPGHPPQQH